MNEKTKAIISAIVVLIANLAALWGVSIDQNVWIDGLCAIVMLVSSVWAIWKNHNFTPEAAEAQKVLDGLKAAKHAKDNDIDEYKG
jgi:uncharacterized membrane protein